MWFYYIDLLIGYLVDYFHKYIFVGTFSIFLSTLPFKHVVYFISSLTMKFFITWSPFIQYLPSIKGFPVAQTVKNLPAMQETQVWSPGQEDSLEKGMATHSSILAWRIPWTKQSCWLQSMGSQRVGQDWTTNTFTFKGITGTSSLH